MSAVNVNQTIYYEKFLRQLAALNFLGDIETTDSSRTVYATDNSIYQCMPEAIIYPKNSDDIKKIMTLLGDDEFRNIILTARGGGTSTNGQCLTVGIVLDTRRYLNNILEINSKEKWARVQSGVVKDQLNAEIEADGLFFAPELSTSNRATIGGMVGTDASGQGSIIYGKTHDHVLEVHTYCIGGKRFKAQQIHFSELKNLQNDDENQSILLNKLYQLASANHQAIMEIFPNLVRSMTGYDLKNLLKGDILNPLAIICGSEGTLGVLDEIKVKLTPIPKYSKLVVIFYKDFNICLTHGKTLLTSNPASVETMDAMVFQLAKTDQYIWQQLKTIFNEMILNKINQCNPAISIVEFVGDEMDYLQEKVVQLSRLLDMDPAILCYQVVDKKDEIKKIWNVRKLSVGLLGNVQVEERPWPFVEDVAVPTDNLAPFTMEFRAILDRYHLKYGIFGHIDAGVLHVRPAIDMKKAHYRHLITPITDEVAALAKHYGGVLWGEHGKGFRSSYVPDFFKELYPLLQQIKSWFDPYNQLNPGKIATPIGLDARLIKVDEIGFRGEKDQQITPALFEKYKDAMHCNGNATCLNFDFNVTMCPTWKATLDLKQSPRGRANLVREWLYRESVKQQSVEFTQEVYEALDHCTGCKSCASQCPIKVSIPDLRSYFFESYYQNKRHPTHHYLTVYLEYLLPWISKVKPLFNLLITQKFSKNIITYFSGLHDLPCLTSWSPMYSFKKAGAKKVNGLAINKLNKKEAKNSVIFIQDAFTSYFETQLVKQCIQLCKIMGFKPWIAPFFPNGKSMHVFGFLERFKKLVYKNSKKLAKLSSFDIDVVGIDSAVTLTYRDEYQKITKPFTEIQVALLVDWLYEHRLLLTSMICDHINIQATKRTLVLHCSEVAHSSTIAEKWQAIYQAIGIDLIYQPLGCCGMAGIYGHEAHHQTTSKQIYENSWGKIVNNFTNNHYLLVTGYSCRSQIKRLSPHVYDRIRHPIADLLSLLSS